MSSRQPVPPSGTGQCGYRGPWVSRDCLECSPIHRDHGYQRGRHALDLYLPVKSSAVTRCLALAIMAIALTAPQALAHGGGLDSNGCHTKSKTGDRHCHRSDGSTTKPSSRLVSGLVSLVSIGDGDTVRVTRRQEEKFTIRLACIDAPEMSQGASAKWSTQTLKGLIQGKSISLKPQVIDHYGRIVAEIYVGNQNINLQMVQAGAAYAYRQYMKHCDRNAYLRAEATAQKIGIGVWGPYKPAQVPWEYRRSRRR